ncbi:hypothetical protein Glove_18g43 [Diversispora epigaea]|uniref:Protein-S-isoprenylcysteine O-methyltransferase n=1 Tax=Diversispora epigaea TaxID=1348612 RepID=A0A397JLF9_9GLOM|nr:hypothetical protein Glove_18g43 [Diversispora epigaea]
MISKFISVTILFYYLEKVSAPPTPNKIKTTLLDTYKREGITEVLFLFLLRKTGRLQLLMIYGFYFYLMYQQEYSGNPKYTSNDLPRLSEWDSAYVLVIMSEFIGITLRLWCYKTLEEFFTFDIKIKKNHKLITHGPYRCLIHPSYAALSFLWPHTVYFASQFTAFIKLYKSSLSPITYSILSYFISICHPSSIEFKILTVLTIVLVLNRIRLEEAMLKDRFGKEWDEYVKTRWRLIPYLI